MSADKIYGQLEEEIFLVSHAALYCSLLLSKTKETMRNLVRRRGKWQILFTKTVFSQIFCHRKEPVL
ncbi:hypothetical cytosolic protein [Syntrophus aciditrophicus SB]|uniref:Hypothetical cytosolic protein n=1 Tax=Syntrophus aciditrophicus (strain SB) TaxID=56780 RepID=Q2LY06_SYNAS|nr:hypothetical cytosolic protein [Syntrophus aciditrophicus SB]